MPIGGSRSVCFVYANADCWYFRKAPGIDASLVPGFASGKRNDKLTHYPIGVTTK